MLITKKFKVPKPQEGTPPSATESGFLGSFVKTLEGRVTVNPQHTTVAAWQQQHPEETLSATLNPMHATWPDYMLRTQEEVLTQDRSYWSAPILG